MNNPFLLKATYETDFRDDGTTDTNYRLSLFIENPECGDSVLVPIDVERLVSTERDSISISIRNNVNNGYPAVSLSPAQEAVIIEHIAFQERMRRLNDIIPPEKD